MQATWFAKQFKHDRSSLLYYPHWWYLSLVLFTELTAPKKCFADFNLVIANFSSLRVGISRLMRLHSACKSRIVSLKLSLSIWTLVWSLAFSALRILVWYPRSNFRKLAISSSTKAIAWSIVMFVSPQRHRLSHWNILCQIKKHHVWKYIKQWQKKGNAWILSTLRRQQ